MTAEEFAALPEGEGRRELVQGEVVEQIPPSIDHGEIAALIVLFLQTWNRQHGHGLVGVESGFLLTHNPDTVRSPDVYYIQAAHVPPREQRAAFGQRAPDLAVEIISPSETSSGVRAKVRDYLAAGTQMVWTVYPEQREVVVHTPDGVARTYGIGATLEFPDVLPGFACTVAELFEETPAT
jgi:Uma2 family endonuclease